MDALAQSISLLRQEQHGSQNLLRQGVENVQNEIESITECLLCISGMEAALAKRRTAVSS
jgi:hypothetical protein